MYQNPYFNQFQFPGQLPYQNQFPGIRQNQFITKQVSNVEEAKACLVDPLSIYLFVDMNSGKIYMKQMNNNGLSDFYTFSVQEGIPEKIDPIETINQRLENIENILGGKSNDKSVSNYGDNSKSKPIFDQPNEKSKPGIIQPGSTNDERKNGNRNQKYGE